MNDHPPGKVPLRRAADAVAAAQAVRARFGEDITGIAGTALYDLLANFAAPDAQGPTAYASQFAIDHPGPDDAELRVDAIVAVRAFHAALFTETE